LGVATASAVPPPGWPERTDWVAAPSADISIGLSAAPAWPRAAQAATASLLLLAVGLLGWHACAAQRWGCRPTELEAGLIDDTRIDLNRADHAQLLQLPGVGDALARRIEDYRREHNGFRSVDELRRVGGIGPGLMARLRPFVCVEPYDGAGEDAGGRTTAPAPAARQENVSSAVSKKKVATGERIDINRATAAELQRLPRVGPKLSAGIIEARGKRPFRSADDLRRVPGIGPKTLELLRPHVMVGEP
jgi:competence protein ComEA